MLPNETHWAIDETQTKVCSISGSGMYICKPGTYCGNPNTYGISLEDDGVPYNKVISYGIVNFDNIGNAIFTVLLIVTTDSWNQHLVTLMDADSPILAGCFYILIVIFGTYFLLNLVLAVIISAFIKIEKNAIEEEIMNAQEFAVEENLITKKHQVDIQVENLDLPVLNRLSPSKT